MLNQLMVFAATDGADGDAVAIAGIAMVTVVTVVIVWQALATARARMSIQREHAYRELAEQQATSQQRINQLLDSIAIDLGDVKSRTGEVERLIKTVE